MEAPEALMSPDPFAAQTDYASRGFDSGNWSDDVLGMKLAQASRMVRSRSPQIDARIKAGTVDKELVTDIVCAMVSRTVPLEGGIPVPAGAASSQLSVDIFQQTVGFGSAGSAQLYISKEECRALGIGGSRIASLDPLAGLE